MIFTKKNIYPRDRRFTGNSCPKGFFWSWGGNGNVPWTCTHGRCYATSCSLHGRCYATSCSLYLHTWSVLRKSWDGVGVGGDGNVLCTCTHGRCYAISCSLHLHAWSVQYKSWDGLGWGGDNNVPCSWRWHVVVATMSTGRGCIAYTTCSSGGAAFGGLEKHAGCIDLDSPSSPRGDSAGASSEMLYAV